MKLREIKESLNLKVYLGEELLDREVTGGYASDLLSDVMGHASEGELWITLQTHKNVVGVASLKDLSAIILVKGFTPEKDTLELAENESIPVLGTDMQTFEFCGILYNLLK
ncbi:MAG: serine kinase [Bacteroidetes bacterium HGW-Bacteroidetes-7]|jgi:predicted transcriptional regulator|nr:MAG: serine kinase [Bacteroidetes bacterium HGW-Bacteroidetes-7]